MSGQSQTPPAAAPTVDPFERLQIALNSDGTLTRNLTRFPRAAPKPNDPDGQTPVLSKDVTINPSTNTWARLFLPRRQQAPASATGNSKLPVVVYYHGGGFILFSADVNISHEVCSDIAETLPAVVVSVNYRLAPEHRLPAAYDDGVEALHWIKTAQEEWLRDYADFSNCFLMGSSAGGNIAYHVGLRVAGVVDELKPLIIKGLILNQPFFGGVQRSESELRSMNDPVLPPIVSDLMWELSLPIGVDRDHEYCNPTAGEGLDKIKSLGWRVMVNGCDGDPLIDRQMEVVKLMEGKGVKVVGNFRCGGFHGEEVFDLSKGHAMHMVLKDFIM